MSGVADAVQFLTLSEVLTILRDQITRYGGEFGVRDLSLLSSAIAVPQAAFAGHALHDNLHAMAAAYAFHICQNHPFVDGNKRVALATALVFLDINGVTISDSDPTGRLYDMMMAVAQSRIGKSVIATLLHKLSV